MRVVSEGENDDSLTDAEFEVEQVSDLSNEEEVEKEKAEKEEAENILEESENEEAVRPN